MKKEKTNNVYPCSFPFEQFYIVPRNAMDIRFCCYHNPIFISDQKKVFDDGEKYLEYEFNNNPTIKKRREAYIMHDYQKAGCNEGCFYFNKYKKTKQGYNLEDFVKNGQYKLNKWWLSVGPDCNATCRYCLEPDKFNIDYNTCNPRIMDAAGEFVKSGGYIMLTGGETFLPKFRFLEILEKLSKEKDVKGYFDCHTNANYLDKKAREIILKAPIKCINVSIDTFRPDLFNYLRRGLDFNNVISNVRELIKERNEAGLQYPHINILCTLLMANCDHIIETADRAIEEGCTMSINGIFRASNSPDFSESQSLNNLSKAKLEKVYKDLKIIQKKHSSKVTTSSILGQLEVFIESAKKGKDAPQVVLGGEDPHAELKVKVIEKYINKKAKNRDIYLWGASGRGKEILNAFADTSVKIKGFIDSDQKKDGQLFQDKKVYHYSMLKNLKLRPYILITSIYEEEIATILEELAFKQNADFNSVANLK